MSRDAEYTNREVAALSQFEKNEFFKGKLMTPRDMEAEQAYHAERFHTLNRFVDGTGSVHGLEIESVIETDDGLEVTVGAGLALDGRGRPVVVEQATTKSLPTPSSDEVHLFVQFDEVSAETVPVPDTEGAVDDDTTSNRTVEVFELTYRETRPEETVRFPDVDVPDLETDDADGRAIAVELAERYHREHRTDTDGASDPAVFLGSFQRTPAGDWVPAEDAPARPVVYDHEFLFAALIDHITDTDNPHRTPVEQDPVDVPDDVEGIMNKLASLEAEIDEIKDERRSFARYVVRKTVKDRIRFFDELSERLERHSGEGSRLAREIAEFSREELGTFDDQLDTYRQQLEQLLDLLIELGEPLRTVTTEKSLERYLKAVSDLQSALEDEASLIELADAHDRVCEAADSLDILVGVVPDE